MPRDSFDQNGNQLAFESLASDFEELTEEVKEVKEMKKAETKRLQVKKGRRNMLIGMSFMLAATVFVGAYYYRVYTTEILPKKAERDIIGIQKFGVDLSGGGYYFKYNNFIYYAEPAPSGKIIKLKDADTDTFKVVDVNYQKDKDHVYAAGRIIEGADPETFKVLDWPYAKDKYRVYYHIIQEFQGVDPKTFVILGGGYQKDKNSVYFKNRRIKGADSDTFEVLGDFSARDKNSLYRYDRAVKR